MLQSPEIRTGDHFVLSPYKVMEPAYLRKVNLYHEQTKGSYMHVIMFGMASGGKRRGFRSEQLLGEYAILLRSEVGWREGRRLGRAHPGWRVS